MRNPSTSRNRILWTAPVVSAIGTLVSGVTQPALAQDPNYDNAKELGAVAVGDRYRPWLQPEGIRAGDYIIHPSIGYGITWNDNIFSGPKKAAVGDVKHDLDARVDFTSHLPRHMLNFMFAGKVGQLQDHEYYQYKDAKASMQFRIDLDRNHKIFGSASYNKGHDDHITTETPDDARKPIELVRSSSEIGFLRDTGKLATSVGVKFDTWNFKDVEKFGGGMIEQDQRDINLLTPFAKISYQASPGYKVLGEVSTYFQKGPIVEPVSHDGRGYEARAGIEFEMSPLVRIALMGGWHVAQFEDPRISGVSRPVWDARVQWLITPLLTLTAKADGQLYPAAIEDSATRIQTRYIFGAEYEMWRNLLLKSEIEWREDRFAGTTRSDTSRAFRFGAEYIHTKNWVFNANYEYRNRESSTTNFDVHTNKVMFGARYRY
jgi:hypothetical protein